MVNKDILMTRLDKLTEYINFLEGIEKYTEEEYVRNPFIYGACERFLHLAIECAIDIGNHIVSDKRYRKPESNRDVFEVFVNGKYFSIKIGNLFSIVSSK